MLTRNLLLRIAAPSLLMGLLMLVSSGSAALYLHLRQSASAKALDEDIRTRRAVDELLRFLEDRAAQAGDQADEEGWEESLRERMARVRALADGPEEARLVGRLEEALAGDQATVSESADATGPPWRASILAARDLGRLEADRIEHSEIELRRIASGMAWGLALVGLVGALAGLTFGYGVARGLGRAVMRAEEMAEVGQIAAGMAHELRNPLTAIKMLVQTNLEEAEARGLPVEDLGVIDQEIRRMESRLNVFIDFARPPKPERRRVALTALVEQTLALIAGRARKQRVRLHYEPPPQAVEIDADAEQIRQLLVNLALNALDVMPLGGLLDVAAKVEDGQAVLDVADTGPGIPSAHLSRLFEPFFTSKEAGLGLGLVVSHRIARDHGGSLHASNRPEGGACFTLRLPVARSNG